jgi:hypothetical protein
MLSENHGAPVALNTHAGLASLFAKRGDMPRALELLMIISEHPASVQATRDRASQLSLELVAQMTSQHIKVAQAQAQATTFEVAVNEILI